MDRSSANVSGEEARGFAFRSAASATAGGTWRATAGESLSFGSHSFTCLQHSLLNLWLSTVQSPESRSDEAASREATDDEREEGSGGEAGELLETVHPEVDTEADDRGEATTHTPLTGRWHLRGAITAIMAGRKMPG
jgi:hypothetical protein